MVGVAFVVEALIVASLGVLTGAALSLVLSYNLVMGGGFSENTEFDNFVVPWGNVALFVGATPGGSDSDDLDPRAAGVPGSDRGGAPL